MRSPSLHLLLVLTFTLLATPHLGCIEAREAKRVKVPVHVGTIRTLDGNSATTFKTKESDYTIKLTSFVITFDQIEFATAGEIMRADLDAPENRSFFDRAWDYISDSILASAYAHAGHAATGDITGELVGSFSFDWLKDSDKDRKLGDADLLEGKYDAANIQFVIPQKSATIHIEGVASRSGNEYRFVFETNNDFKVDSRQVLGEAVAKTVEETKKTKITFDFLPRSTEPDSLSFFDQVDFESLKTEKPSTDPRFDVQLLHRPKNDDPQSYKVAYTWLDQAVTEKHDYHALTFTNLK